MRDISSVPSVALFVERARAVKPDFELTDENAAPVAGICVALDGVPLAIELAAARIRMLRPTAMLERLDRQLPLLAGGVRDLPARQQTIRSTIEWSSRFSARTSARMLSRLGVFAGPFSLEAVESVWAQAGETPTRSSLGMLVDSSLVRQLDHDERSLLLPARDRARVRPRAAREQGVLQETAA